MNTFIAEIRQVTSSKGKDGRVAKVTLQFFVEDNEEVLNELISYQEELVKCSIAPEETLPVSSLPC